MMGQGTGIGSNAAAIWVIALILALAALAMWWNGRTKVTALSRDLQAERAATHASALREAEARVTISAHSQRVAELVEERDGLQDALHHARQATGALERELSETRLTARKDAEASARELALLREVREEMTGQFRLLADDSLRRQGADLEKAHSERLTSMLTPFREQVQHFQKELSDRNKAVGEERAALREQIEGLHRRSEEIGRDAVALTRALKGEKQRQGAWGEMILERILEQSGLEPDLHYVSQSSHVDADGKRWRPDVIVKMPRQRVLVVDSKVSLVDYAEACDCDDPAQREVLLKRHAAALKKHVTDLAARGYDALAEGSVDYVLMFVPVEGAFSEAMRADPDLASFALDKRVGLATPTTLMLTLRTVEHVWTVERRESNAAEIAARAGQLYDKVAGFVDAMEDAGKAIHSASVAHDKAMNRLTRGSGNVVRQIEMLRELGARNQKRIDLDHDRSEMLPLTDRARHGPRSAGLTPGNRRPHPRLEGAGKGESHDPQ